ncbi:hypothetical protein IW261DRAFT_1519020 [Armillaria novae-zelandiae]|uniref:Uncharacterized protein n=1 Tax=Armillaria novae-zelandiae TaxID=153914 RepID=A0AA39TVE5_9AGAR|nr:hypothetical protein IW261DRAFT_1519020 [Armillaria novae-zelandiae]
MEHIITARQPFLVQNFIISHIYIAQMTGATPLLTPRSHVILPRWMRTYGSSAAEIPDNPHSLYEFVLARPVTPSSFGVVKYTILRTWVEDYHPTIFLTHRSRSWASHCKFRSANSSSKKMSPAFSSSVVLTQTSSGHTPLAASSACANACA